MATQRRSSMASSYVAVHKFSGNAAESQLQFGKGEVIFANAGQSGDWWWGALQRNGVKIEGWFPPTYVKRRASQAPAPTPAAAPAPIRQVMAAPRTSAASSSITDLFAPAVTSAPSATTTPAPAASNNLSMFSGMSSMSTPAAATPALDPFASVPAQTVAQTAAQTAARDPFASVPAQIPTPATSHDPFASVPAAAAAAAPASDPFASVPVKSQAADPFESAGIMQPTPAASEAASAVSSAFGFMGSTPTPAPVPAPAASKWNANNKPPPPPKPSKKQQDAASLMAGIASPTPTPAPAPAPASSVANTITDLFSSHDFTSAPAMTLQSSPVRANVSVPSYNTNWSTPVAATNQSFANNFNPLTTFTPDRVNRSDFPAILGVPAPPPPLSKSVYTHPTFFTLFSLSSFIPAPVKTPHPNTTSHYSHLLESIHFIISVVNNSPNCPASMKRKSLVLETAAEMICSLPFSSKNSPDSRFVTFLDRFVYLVKSLPNNEMIVAPGGWLRPESTHLLLYILKKNNDDTFSFTVCNTGDTTEHSGLEYHPAQFNPNSGKMERNMALTLYNIPASRVTDGSFWALLFRMQVYPSSKHGPEILYTRLLPALNNIPLRANLQTPHAKKEFHPPPDPRLAQSYHHLALLAFTTDPTPGTASAEFCTLNVMEAAAARALDDMNSIAPGTMELEDSKIVRLSLRTLANAAASTDMSRSAMTEVDVSKKLDSIKSLLTSLQASLSSASTPPPTPNTIPQNTTDILNAEKFSACCPRFGRFRRDDFANIEKKLMGESTPDPILIPSVITTSPPNVTVATNHQMAASLLRKACDSCSIILQQRLLVKNAAAIAAAACQYALTVTLPFPTYDPKTCFYRSVPMRRETQINLLTLIQRICRIYQAATTTVQNSRNLQACRSTTFATALCIADCISRIVAEDDPSEFSLHYSGEAEGPTSPFGISAGSFETLGSQLPVFDAKFSALRSHCLDYLHHVELHGGGLGRCIFSFDQSLVPSAGDVAFTTQMCIRLALPVPDRNQVAMLLSGADGSLMELLPELVCFRDIAFYFKHSVSGTAPCAESKAFLPAHATLHWSVGTTSDKKKGEQTHMEIRVMAFNNHPQTFVEYESGKKTRFENFMRLFSKSSVERNKLSSADPTNVVACCSSNPKRSKKPIEIDNEDDILHLKAEDLPSFGGVLSPPDSERFLSFLTVPYMRIPLILDFFANGDPGRISALRCASLQSIVDGALFEPGRWKSADFSGKITHVPIVDEVKKQELLATPCGKLFNEIVKSPDVIVTSVIKILERALDMDVGKYDPKRPSGPLILYSIRLAVRLEGYIKFAIKNYQDSMGLSFGDKKRIRGLEGIDIPKLSSLNANIHDMLHSRAFPLLESWLGKSGISDGDDSCLIHAHLLYLFKNHEYDDLDFTAVSSIMASQIFLNINHRFVTISYDDLYSNTHSEGNHKPSEPPPSIQIPQNEVFDLVQTHRSRILQFIEKNKDIANECFEATVRVATNIGTRIAPFESEENVKKHSNRSWQLIPHPSNFGRFIPDTENENLRDGSYRVPKPGQTYADWMLETTTKSVGTELNLQVSDFTLQNHKLTLLDESVVKNEDFKDAFLNEINNGSTKISDVACAEVMHTTNRYWWRLIGRRFDVQSWAPDVRLYHEMSGAINKEFTRTYSNSLRGGEKWICDILAGKIELLLPGVKLKMRGSDQSRSPFVEMAGFFTKKEEGDESKTNGPPTLKEVVVFRYPPTIQIYNVHEYGRRFFRVLEYTSNTSLCLHDVEGDPYPDRVNGLVSLSAGSPWTTVPPKPSLVVSRRLSATLGVQTFLPARFLSGTLPSCLLEQYRYWQGENDDIIGEPIDPKSKYQLTIKLVKDAKVDKTGFCSSSDAYAVVSRTGGGETHTLLNVMTAPDGTGLKELGLMFSRLDNLSHVCFWTFDALSNPTDASSIDLVELPRIKMRFNKQTVETSHGKFHSHLYSQDHDGLYLTTSPKARDAVENLLGSAIPHYVVLSNDDEELYALIPSGALPRRLYNDGLHLNSVMVLDRRNKEWIDNLGPVRFYLYPIHPSQSFVSTPSLASSLYLLLLRFISADYQGVFKMIESCVSDKLDLEEEQIWEQMAFLGNDSFPDAHACRLKFSAVISGFDDTMKAPWSIGKEMLEYVRKWEHVSASCRLTNSEELSLLSSIFDSSENSAGLNSHEVIELQNRRSFTTAVKKLEMSQEASVPLADRTLTLVVDNYPVIQNYDSVEDTSILDNSGVGVAGKFFGVTYSKPSEETLLQGGPVALALLNGWLSTGIELNSVSKQGFPLLYDICSGSLPLRILPSDDPHNYARLLTRMLPPSDYMKKSTMMSALRLLTENPKVAKSQDLPKLKNEGTFDRMKSVFKGKDAVTTLVDQLHAYFQRSSSAIKLPSSTVNETMIQGTLTVLDRDEFFSANRIWNVPRVTVFDGEVFNCNVSSFERIRVKKEKLVELLMSPLGKVERQYVQKENLREVVGSDLPFVLPSTSVTNSHASQRTLQRLRADCAKYASSVNGGSRNILVGFGSDFDANHIHKGKSTVEQLIRDLRACLEEDQADMNTFIKLATDTVSKAHLAGTGAAGGAMVAHRQYVLAQRCGREAMLQFEQLVATMMSSSSMLDIASVNPYLDATAIENALNSTLMATLLSTRIGQTRRCLNVASKLTKLLRNPRCDVREVTTAADNLASALATRRHFVKGQDSNRFSLNPVYAAFEFSHDLILRKPQVLLVDKFMDSLKRGTSLAHQMLMGVGKTTVVAPLLALLLADGRTLTVNVVPHALIEMTRSVFRSRFSSVVRKPVFELKFDRYSKIDASLYTKLEKARAMKAVVVASPTAIKSLVLAYVDQLRNLELERASTKNNSQTAGGLFGLFRKTLKNAFNFSSVDASDTYYASRILELFKTGVLAVDEVDAVLHPLKSELNWPCGDRIPLDFTAHNLLGGGVRWKLAWHLFDGIFAASGAELKSTSGMETASMAAKNVLVRLKEILVQGISIKALQKCPHLVLLDRKEFYHSKLKPALSEWLLLYIRELKVGGGGVDDRTMLTYLNGGPSASESGTSQISVALDDDGMKTVNLGYELLNSLFPFLLSRVNRVTFGLLNAEQINSNPSMPRTRKLSAVPFVGKDTPSRASQFSHPDVVIGLTILAFRYEGLRLSDYKVCISDMKERLETEFGEFRKRKTAKFYEKMVVVAGAKIKGKRDKGEEKKEEMIDLATGGDVEEVWPLHLLDLHDEEHMSITFDLLRSSPHMIEYYLDLILPEVTEHFPLKISASGQELGGSLLFGRRVGFSGTPSELMPEELGRCAYEEGSDGRIIAVLTDPNICGCCYVPDNWNVKSLLNLVIQSHKSVLIDTGALITGMSNRDVAEYLLLNGLDASKFDGVVYLDEDDVKMILLREGLIAVRLSQAGVPIDRRFTFYDQVHTTGMDIKQSTSSVAWVTLGKDMTFRDYAQGAFRMRGIGKGQRIILMIIPEVRELVNTGGKDDDFTASTPTFGGISATATAGSGNDLLQIDFTAQSSTAVPQIMESADRALLTSVASWLVLNGMRSENLQFNVLSEQSLRNVWRKRAFKTLTLGHEGLVKAAFGERRRRSTSGDRASAEEVELAKLGSMASASQGDVEKIRQLMVASKAAKSSTPKADIPLEVVQKCIDVFVERIDFTVPNSIPHPTLFSTRLRSEVQEHKNMMTDDDSAICDKLMMQLQSAEDMMTRGDKKTALAGASEAEMSLNQEQTQEEEEEEEEEEEQEEEQEQEQEQEEESVPCEPKKKKYSRDDEKPQPWDVNSLTSGIPKQFYQLSDFSVKNDLFSKKVQLSFPNYIHASNNYFVPGWGLRSHRRLKNIIVALSWIPNKGQLADLVNKDGSFSKQQEDSLRKAFEMVDVSKTGGLNREELKEVLSACDVDVDGKDGEQFLNEVFGKVDVNHDGTVSFSELANMVRTGSYNKEQSGRYYAALSLVEAESFRAFMHTEVMSVGGFGGGLGWGGDTTAVLFTNRTLLDITAGYTPGSEYQDGVAQACYRFVDSQLNFDSRQITWLLNSLSSNDIEMRRRFYEEVKSNRRRKNIRVDNTALAKLFVTPDQYHEIQHKVTMRRIHQLIVKKKLFINDCFNAFDYDKDGRLSQGELFGGLEWLGMKCTVNTVQDIMMELDEDKDGFITLEEFKRAILDGEEEDTSMEASRVSLTDLQVKPIHMGGENQSYSKGPKEIPRSVLANIKIKVKACNKFDKIWTSQGTLSRAKASVWEPVLGGFDRTFRQNKALVCVGHYCGNGYDNPSKDERERLILEVTDMGTTRLGSSDWLNQVLDRFMPNPARFRLVWSVVHGSNSFYCWEPIPPGEAFVALGMIGTRKEKPPKLTSVRCVPKSWVTKSEVNESVWNDSGGGGRSGSIWHINKMYLMKTTVGHDPPKGNSWELKSWRFMLRQFSDINGTEGGGYTAPTVGGGGGIQLELWGHRAQRALLNRVVGRRGKRASLGFKSWGGRGGGYMR